MLLKTMFTRCASRGRLPSLYKVINSLKPNPIYINKNVEQVGLRCHI